MLKKCPFSYTRYNPETGRNHVAADNVFPDDRGKEKLCNFGKGPWCKQCQTYRQSLMSNEKWKRIYRRMGKTGKAPHLWRKPNPALIVNPLDLSLRNSRRL